MLTLMLWHSFNGVREKISSAIQLRQEVASIKTAFSNDLKSLQSQIVWLPPPLSLQNCNVGLVVKHSFLD